MKRPDDPNQTLIDWSNPAAVAAAPVSSIPDPIKLAAQAPPTLIERLPWDFKTTFPEPTEEVLAAGTFLDEDNHSENIKALHHEHVREALTILQGLDAILDARRRGIDPKTGKPPRTHASRERLRELYETEPPRLERAFNSSLETYEEVFGPEAAQAFNRFIKATHAGIPVEIDSAPRPLLNSPSNPLIAASSPQDAAPPRKRRNHPGSSRLPVPRPLPEAIKAGHFGLDEQDKPITPTPDEVRAITEQHAERIIDLLDGRRQMERSATAPQCSDRSRVGAEAARLGTEVQAMLDKYAASFGRPAAEQLERYCQRQRRERSR